MCLWSARRAGDAQPAGPPTEDGGQACQEQFLALRSSQAEALWQLALQALNDNHCALAFQLATAAVREDPDHAAARRLLGYQPIDGQWATAFARRKRQRGYVWHERLRLAPAGGRAAL